MFVEFRDVGFAEFSAGGFLVDCMVLAFPHLGS